MRLLTLLLLLLFPASTIVAKESKHKKTLILIIASDDLPVYNSLQEIWKRYMHRYKEDFEAYFIRLDRKSPKKGEVIGETLYLQGEESTIPGILEKTILSLCYFSPRFKEFNYILRTNLSSFYVLPRLKKFIKSLPKKRCYGGVPITTGNFSFASGAGYILSTDLAEKIVKEGKTILQSHGHLYDDVALGRFFHAKKISITKAERVDFLTMESWKKNRDKISKNSYHFRVKNEDLALRESVEPEILNEMIEMFYPERGLVHKVRHDLGQPKRGI